MNQFIVKTMSRADLDLALEWAAQEGWNPGWHGADAFYATDPNGFFTRKKICVKKHSSTHLK